MRKASTVRRDVAAEVTDRIVAALESGVAPWTRPWTSSSSSEPALGLPVNGATGRAYRGANILILWSSAITSGYSDPRWMTFKQALDLGACVRKGEHGTGVVFWKSTRRTETDPTTGEETSRGGMFARFYTVFNVAQIDGLPERFAPAPVTASAPVETMTVERNARVDAAVAATNAVIAHGGDRAFYQPSTDSIRLPAAESFKSADHYYSTMLHEVTHWTGHASRLDRKLQNRFGDDAYAAEELIAELGSAFLCALLGVRLEGLQHAEYLGHWIKVLKADKFAIFTASSAAQKAADFVLDAGADDEEATDEVAA